MPHKSRIEIARQPGHEHSVTSVFAMLWFSVVVLLASAWSAQAADYRSQIELGTSFLFDDNRLLQREGKAAASRVLISPVWTNRLVDERYTLDAVTGVDAIRSFNDSVENDRFDYRGNMNFTYRYPVSTLRVSGGFNRVSQLDAQFQDGGVLGQDNVQRRYNGSIGWETQLTEVTSLSLDAGIQNQRFSGILLQNFLSFDGSIGLNRALSERWSAGVFVSGQHQKTQNPLFGDTTTGSVFLSTQYSLSEVFTLSGQAGVITIDNDQNSTTDWTAQLGLTYANKGWTLDVNVGRDFAPGGNGTVRDSYSGDVSARYDFTSRLQISAAATYRESEIFGLAGQDTQLSATTSLRWRILTNLNMDVTYTFRDQELNNIFAGGLIDATANTLQVRLRYFYPSNGLGD